VTPKNALRIKANVIIKVFVQDSSNGKGVFVFLAPPVVNLLRSSNLQGHQSSEDVMYCHGSQPLESVSRAKIRESGICIYIFQCLWVGQDGNNPLSLLT
jgi:hypothetical protein